MARIRTYPGVEMPEDFDKVIGTDFVTNKTKNFNWLNVSKYLSQNGFADPARNALTLQFQVPQGGETQSLFGSMIVVGNTGRSINLDETLTSVRVSHKNLNNVSFKALLEYWTGSDIKIQSTQGIAEANFGIYRLSGVTEFNDDFFDLTLQGESYSSETASISDQGYVSISSIGGSGSGASSFHILGTDANGSNINITNINALSEPNRLATTDYVQAELDDKHDSLPDLETGAVWTYDGSKVIPEFIEIVGLIDEHSTADARGVNNVNDGNEEEQNLVINTSDERDRADGRWPTTEAWQKKQFQDDLGVTSDADEVKFPKNIVLDSSHHIEIERSNGVTGAEFDYSTTSNSVIIAAPFVGDDIRIQLADSDTASNIGNVIIERLGGGSENIIQFDGANLRTTINSLRVDNDTTMEGNLTITNGTDSLVITPETTFGGEIKAAASYTQTNVTYGVDGAGDPTLVFQTVNDNVAIGNFIQAAGYPLSVSGSTNVEDYTGNFVFTIGSTQYTISPTSGNTFTWNYDSATDGSGSGSLTFDNATSTPAAPGTAASGTLTANFGETLVERIIAGTGTTLRIDSGRNLTISSSGGSEGFDIAAVDVDGDALDITSDNTSDNPLATRAYADQRIYERIVHLQFLPTTGTGSSIELTNAFEGQNLEVAWVEEGYVTNIEGSQRVFLQGMYYWDGDQSDWVYWSDTTKEDTLPSIGFGSMLVDISNDTSTPANYRGFKPLITGVNSSGVDVTQNFAVEEASEDAQDHTTTKGWQEARFAPIGSTGGTDVVQVVALNDNTETLTIPANDLAWVFISGVYSVYHNDSNNAFTRTGPLGLADLVTALDSSGQIERIVRTGGGGGSNVSVNEGGTIASPKFTAHPPAGAEGTYIYSPGFQQDGSDVSVQIDTRRISDDIGVPALKSTQRQILDQLSQAQEYNWLEETIYQTVFLTKRSDEYGNISGTSLILQPRFHDNDNTFVTFADLTPTEIAAWNNASSIDAIIGFGPDTDSLIPFQYTTDGDSGHGSLKLNPYDG